MDIKRYLIAIIISVLLLIGLTMLLKGMNQIIQSMSQQYR